MPSHRPRASLVLVALSLLSACACASAGQRFDGAWSYWQSCGFEHSANLELKQQGASLTGEWDDGTRVTGDSGKLEGEVHGNRATVGFCSDGDADRSSVKCPQFGESTDTFVRVGDTLVWSRRSGATDRPYITLHRAGSGKRTAPVDDRCDDDAPEDGSDADKEATP